tara:strand:- start:11951 stop:13537 length:1587 start_codon:yes stop_codon:yes gene_type:complete
MGKTLEIKNDIKNSYKTIGTISLVILSGIIVRLIIFPYDIPFKLDSLDYFSYAFTTSQIGELPRSWALANNGWPVIISFFFRLFNGEFLDYVFLQRFTSVIFSVFTVIPLFFIAKHFVPKNIAILSTIIFIFEPRIILNSLNGETMPIYIFIGVSIISLFLTNRIRYIHIAFMLIAILTFIRYEGILLIIPLSIMFFWKYKNKKEIITYVTIIGLFLLVLTPIVYLRIDAYEQDGISSHLIRGGEYVSITLTEGYSDDEPWVNEEKDNVSAFFYSGINGIIKFFGFSLIPIFGFFVIPSIILCLKEKSFSKINFKMSTIIFAGIVFLIPAFFAYGRHLEEIRYMMIVYPFLAIFSVYIITKLYENQKKIFLFIIISGILISSSAYIVFSLEDYNHEREAFSIAEKVVSLSNGYNIYTPESQYIKTAEVSKNWPSIPEHDDDGHVKRKILRIDDMNFESIKLFLTNSESQGITHLIIDNRSEPKFLKEVFLNEEKFPYLTKIYDSNNDNLKYKVKIFEINFEKFHKFTE